MIDERFNFSLAVSERSFYHHAAINPWLMLLIFGAAGAMIFYLYRAQQRIASRRLVGALTVLRMLLIVSLFVLLLQPGYRWKHTRRTAGTLWVVLDASQSMALTDPQSTPIERLRWADALGYLPDGLRTLHSDETAARLGCLRDDLNRLQAVNTFAGKSDSGGASVERFREAMRAWQKDVDDAANQLAADAKTKASLGTVSDQLRKVSGLAAGGVEAASSTVSAADAVKVMPWQKIDVELSAAIKTLLPIADEVDREFLANHAQNSGLEGAIAKMAKLSRADLALAQLTIVSKRWPQSLKDLFPNYTIRVASFADKARPVSPGDAAGLAGAFKQALTPTGSATSLIAALELISEQAIPDEPTSVLLLSDGRQNMDGDPARAARQLASQDVRVYCVSIGSTQPAVDIAVDNVDAPAWIYKDDKLTARATIRAEGLAGKELSVELWRGGTKIDTKKFTSASGSQSKVITFDDQHAGVGVFDYEVRVDAGPAEENKQNNRQAFRVSVRDEALKLLLVDDQPRWEYRHLVSYLSRDKSVKLQTVLLRPTRIDDVGTPMPVKASPKNEKPEAQRLPETPEEWAAFDVIVLGDVTRDALPVATQEAIVAAVRNAGKTLIIMAGPRAMPGAYINAPLADAIPVQLTTDWSADALAAHLTHGFRVGLTPQGAASVLGQLSADSATNHDVWAGLPLWFWHSEQTTAKPSAEVLLSIIDGDRNADATSLDPTQPDPSRRRALMATTTLGLGRVLYLASDQTWRLRQVNGQNLQDRFWGQVLRWALGSDLPSGGEFARFGTDKPHYTEGEPVVFTARLSKDDHTALIGQKAEVVARLLPERSPATSPASQPMSQPVIVTEAKLVAQATLNEVADAPGLYRVSVKGLTAGHFELGLRGEGIESLLKDVTDARLKAIPIEVRAVPTVEQRNTNVDQQKMAEIARAGGGAFVDGPYASVLSRFIPQPKVDDVRYEQLGLFGDQKNYYTRLSHWIFMAVFATLISAEWILRKVGGLV